MLQEFYISNSIPRGRLEGTKSRTSSCGSCQTAISASPLCTCWGCSWSLGLFSRLTQSTLPAPYVIDVDVVVFAFPFVVSYLLGFGRIIYALVMAEAPIIVVRMRGIVDIRVFLIFLNLLNVQRSKCEAASTVWEVLPFFVGSGSETRRSHLRAVAGIGSIIGLFSGNARIDWKVVFGAFYILKCVLDIFGDNFFLDSRLLPALVNVQFLVLVLHEKEPFAAVSYVLLPTEEVTVIKFLADKGLQRCQVTVFD